MAMTPPASGACTPARILIRVDLPEPFSPTRQCTSPDSTDQSIASSALVPPKRLPMPESVRNAISTHNANEAAAPATDRGRAQRNPLRSDDLSPGVDGLRVQIDLLVGADHLGLGIDL